MACSPASQAAQQTDILPLHFYRIFEPQMEKAIIIGSSPAAYMCAIYMHTANITPLIIKTRGTDLDFSGSENVAGVNANTPEEFTALVEAQTRNMGIRVMEDEVLDISRSSNMFKVRTNGEVHETKSLIIDDSCMEGKYRQELGNEGVFYTNDRISHREAIVVASAGCKTSFDVKEFIESVTK